MIKYLSCRNEEKSTVFLSTSNILIPLNSSLKMLEDENLELQRLENVDPS